MTLNEHNIYESRVLLHVPFWQTDIFYTIIALIFALLFLILILYAVKKWYSRKTVQSPSAQEQAIIDMRMLKEQYYVDGISAKEFYAQLSSILKRFISDYYHIPVQSYTDEELISYLKKNNDGRNVITVLQPLLEGWVYIKFAQASALKEQIDHDCAQVINLIALLDVHLNNPE